MSDKYEERRKEWQRRLRDRPQPERDIAYASEDADELSALAARLVAASTGSSWYEQPGEAADAAVAALCRLRRASAGHVRASEGGDEAVRRVLSAADAEAVVWLASRTISFMDEHGFPEIVEPWVRRD
jgi:hypothetical protein